MCGQAVVPVVPATVVGADEVRCVEGLNNGARSVVAEAKAGKLAEISTRSHNKLAAVAVSASR